MDKRTNRDNNVGGVSPPCEHCGSTFTTVIDKRDDSEYNRGDIRRRRECLECGGRFTTWEIRKSLYETVKENHQNRNRGITLFNNLQRGGGIDRFKSLAILNRGAIAADLWNDPTFVLGIEYGAMIALAEVFKLEKGDIE